MNYIIIIILNQQPFLLNHFFSVDPYKYFLISNEDENYPRIRCSMLENWDQPLNNVFDEETSFEVVIEFVTVSQSKDFIQTFMVYLASFYICNTEYPSSLTAKLTLLQKFFRTGILSKNESKGYNAYRQNKKAKIGL